MHITLMSIGDHAFHELGREHFARLRFIENTLSMSLPSLVWFDFQGLSEAVHIDKVFRMALRVGYSLKLTLDVLNAYTVRNNDNRARVLGDLRKATRLDGFWQACESHGRIVGEKDRTNAASSARHKFVDAIKDPPLALAVSFILESIATSGGSDAAVEAIHRRSEEQISHLRSIDGFPYAKFMALCADCAKPAHRIERRLPRTLEALRVAVPSDKARACWISHHLWTMDRTSRCLFLTGRGDFRTLRTLDRLAQQDRDRLYEAERPALFDYDRHHRRFPADREFCPALHLLPLCQ